MTTADTKAPQVSPRGTDRIRRRSQQAAAKVQEQTEAATNHPPQGAEKKRRIAAAKAKDLATFGPSKRSRTRAAQEKNKKRAETEIVELSAKPEAPRPKLVPGSQVDLITARRMTRANDREERDEINDAARAAGLAVRDTLRGRPARDRHSRARRIAQHNAKAAQTAQV